jgi:hypothetical protein
MPHERLTGDVGEYQAIVEARAAQAVRDAEESAAQEAANAQALADAYARNGTQPGAGQPRP